MSSDWRFISHNIAIILLLASCAGAAFAAGAKDPFYLYILEDKTTSGKYRKIEPMELPSSMPGGEYGDITPDHWAYRAVKHLSEIGLLGGYGENLFRVDAPVSRYELAVIVSRLVSNFNQYISTGTLPAEGGIAPPAFLPATVASLPPISGFSGDAAVRAPAPGGVVAGAEKSRPGEMVWLDPRPELGPVGPMSHGRPKMLEVKEKIPADTPQPAVAPAEKEREKESDKDKKKNNDKEKKTAPKPPKEFEKLAKKIELTDRDVEILEALVDYIKKDVVKDLKAEVKKDIDAVNRQVQKNKRDIDRLEEENERFKVTGGVGVSYESRMYENNSAASAWTSRWLSTSLYSKPRKFDDLTFRSSLTSGGDLRIYYQDYTTKRETPKNFKLRLLYAGGVSFGASPMTSMGRDYTGFQTELKLNDYTFKSYIGKLSSTRMLHAESLQFSVFETAGSFGYLTNLSWWDDADVVTTPEKNSVRSFYFRYPMPIAGMYITAEYAHSNYHRPEKKMAMPGKSPDYEWKDHFTEWLYIPEMTSQDDAYFVLLDYSKGPLAIFPLGYVKLGPKFVSKYLGLPGFDASTFGIDVLPINLQSLAVWVLRGTYTKTEKHYRDEFIYVTGGETEPMYLDASAMSGNTTNDILLTMIGKLNNRKPGDTIDLLYYNNKLTYYMSDDISLTWEYSNVKAGLGPVCLDGNNTYVENEQGETVYAFFGNGFADCDKLSPTYDDKDLEILFRFYQKSQNLNLYWRTSKKAEFSMDYGFSDNRINVESSMDSVRDAVAALVDQGRNYHIKYNLKYRLTDISRVEMWYRTYYGRPGMQLTVPDKTTESHLGVQLTMDY